MIAPGNAPGLTLVLGLGNPCCGDDGAGLRAVEMLSRRQPPPHVRLLLAGLPGWGLVDQLQGCRRAVFVDSAHLGEAPGTWRRLEAGQVRLRAAGKPLSLHAPGLAEGLALAQALEALPEEMVFYCIEPASTTAGSSLSPEVEAALPSLVEALLEELWKRDA